MILSASYNQTSIEKIKNSFVVNKVKEIVHRYDKEAEIILFGSRARGDWHEESDWDFLILTKKQVTPELEKQIIYDAADVEVKEGICLQFLIKNKKSWEEDYSVTPIFYNIKEEGLQL
jgi:predicted nucleotidyltransferase